MLEKSSSSWYVVLQLQSLVESYLDLIWPDFATRFCVNLYQNRAFIGTLIKYQKCLPFCLLFGFGTWSADTCITTETFCELYASNFCASTVSCWLKFEKTKCYCLFSIHSVIFSCPFASQWGPTWVGDLDPSGITFLWQTWLSTCANVEFNQSDDISLLLFTFDLASNQEKRCSFCGFEHPVAAYCWAL